MFSLSVFNPARSAFDVQSLLCVPIVILAFGCGAPDPTPVPATSAEEPTKAVNRPADKAIDKPSDTAAVVQADTDTVPGSPKPTAVVQPPVAAAPSVATVPPVAAAPLVVTASPESVEDGLVLTTVVVGTGVEERNLIGESTRFTVDTKRLYCWTGLSNTGDTAQIIHVWRYGEREIARHTLDVRHTKKHRTWSYQRVGSRRKGRWSCEVLGPDGARLGLLEFEVGLPVEADVAG